MCPVQQCIDFPNNGICDDIINHLPQQVLDVLAGRAALLVNIGKCVDCGSAPVLVDFRPRFEGELVHEANVPLVQESVFHLK